MSEWYDPFVKGLRQGAFIFTHFLLALLLLLTGFAGDYVLREWLGDPKLFDAVPWRYLLGFMDGALFLTFVVTGVLEAIRVYRDE